MGVSQPKRSVPEDYEDRATVLIHHDDVVSIELV